MNNPLPELRARRSMTQSQLAEAAGLSQATISRLESSLELPTDPRLLGKVAKGLEIPLSDLLPGDSSTENEQFFAFCPNPFCRDNEFSLQENGTAQIAWNSSQSFSSTEFNELNYCHLCGTELVKDCANCGKRLERKYMKFCRKCGKEICARPTAEEWQKIKEILIGGKLPPPPATREVSGEEDIPF